jgi:hypothetical protein
VDRRPVCPRTRRSFPLPAAAVGDPLPAPPDPTAATTRHGTGFPLGATVFPDGVNFSVFSRQATRIELLLFDGVDQAQPSGVIELDPRNHRT